MVDQALASFIEIIQFSRCKINYQETEYDGFVYYPDPKTKKEHFQELSTVEVLAPFIDGIKYGDTVAISLNQAEIKGNKK